MVNYNNGKIYRIIPKEGGEEGDVYIGSTTKQYLSQRMTAHRSQYNSWKNGKTHITTSFLLFDKYGIENCTIELIELVNASCYDELAAREGFHIRNTKCINKIIPDRKKDEYNKMYREENREYIAEQKKLYREENREYIAEQKKLYQEQNKEKRAETWKKYYEENKESILEKKKAKRAAKTDLKMI
jgi:hypothetical protein